MLVKNKLGNEFLMNLDFEKEVQKVVKSIYADPNWLEGVKEKAIKNNISLDEAVGKDAVWVVNEKLGKS